MAMVIGCGAMRGANRSSTSSDIAAALAIVMPAGSLLSRFAWGDDGGCGCGWGCGLRRNGSVGALPDGGTNCPGGGGGGTTCTGPCALPGLMPMPPVLNCPGAGGVVAVTGRGAGVNGSTLDCDSMRGVTPRKVRLFVVPTHIGA